MRRRRATQVDNIPYSSTLHILCGLVGNSSLHRWTSADRSLQHCRHCFTHVNYLKTCNLRSLKLSLLLFFLGGGELWRAPLAEEKGRRVANSSGGGGEGAEEPSDYGIWESDHNSETIGSRFSSIRYVTSWAAVVSRGARGRASDNLLVTEDHDEPIKKWKF